MSCHPSCLVMLHCAFAIYAVNGKMQLPHDRLWLLCEIAQASLHYIGPKLASRPQTTTMHGVGGSLVPQA